MIAWTGNSITKHFQRHKMIPGLNTTTRLHNTLHALYSLYGYTCVLYSAQEHTNFTVSPSIVWSTTASLTVAVAIQTGRVTCAGNDTKLRSLSRPSSILQGWLWSLDFIIVHALRLVVSQHYVTPCLPVSYNIKYLSKYLLYNNIILLYCIII